MGLESGTWVNDLVATNPPSGDLTSQGDDHLRLLKTVLRNTFPNASKAFYFFDYANKTSNYTVLSTDEHVFFNGDGTSGSVPFTLPNLSASLKGWYCFIKASNLTNAVTITPTSGNINGGASFTFSIASQTALVWFDGTNWWAMADRIVDIVNATALTSPAVDDSLIIYDLSATANRKIALSDLWKVINVLTAELVPDAADKVAIYDTSEGAANSNTLEVLFRAPNTFTEDTDPDNSADFISSYDTSATAAKKVAPYRFINKIAVWQDSKVANTAGGGTTSGSFQTHILQTEVVNTITGASLATNQMTLPAGRYHLEAWMIIRSSDLATGKIRNTTDGSDALIGSVVDIGNTVSAQLPILVSGIIDIAAQKVFELQYRVQTGLATIGLGRAGNLGINELYAQVTVRKIK